MADKERFYNIDFIKFLFAIIIVILHFPLICNKLWHTSGNARIIVDFFFIMSGFFLFKNIDKSISMVKFAVKRLIRLMPPILFLYFLAMISSLFSKELTFNLNDNLTKILFIHPLGFTPSTGLKFYGITWFVTVLFWVSLFYFYLYKICEKKIFNLIVWLIIMVNLYIYYNTVHYGIGAAKVPFVINVSRALFGLGIGYFISMLYSTNFLRNCSKSVQLAISVLEIYCLIFISEYAVFVKKIPGKTGFLLIIMFSLLFYLFLIKKGIVSKILDNKYLGHLGKYSYSIYTSQCIIFLWVNYFIYLTHPVYFKTHLNFISFMMCVGTIICAIITYHLIEIPSAKYLNKKFFK